MLSFTPVNVGTAANSGDGETWRSAFQKTNANFAAIPSWGDVAKAADATNDTATLASTGLSVALTAGQTYRFQAVLFLSDSVSEEGVKVDLGGGDATATLVIAEVKAFDASLNTCARVSSLTGAVSAATFTGAGAVEITGFIHVNAGGTFIPRFSQASHATGTVTLSAGSFLSVALIP